MQSKKCMKGKNSTDLLLCGFSYNKCYYFEKHSQWSFVQDANDLMQDLTLNNSASIRQNCLSSLSMNINYYCSSTNSKLSD